MRLLNTTTYRLHDFFSKKEKPHYAILSHCWVDEEVSFQHMRDSQMTDEGDVRAQEYDGNAAPSPHDFAHEFPVLAEMQRYHKRKMTARKGWQKIVGFCEEARRRGYEYAWIDTCCIDKSSSSELTEAINSMWKWYWNSKLCIVYMHDFQKPDGWRESDDKLSPSKQAELAEHNRAWGSGFVSSKWFFRGWTLQELLAPQYLVFVDRFWENLGTRRGLTDLASAATGIPLLDIFNRCNGRLDFFSIAQRMSWAAKRETTREEDIAYCLLGLFRISMPLLYGEGAKSAFRRLQEEIMKHDRDESIFLWEAPPSNGFFQHSRSRMLADHPDKFTERPDVEWKYSYYILGRHRTPFWRVQGVVHIELSLKEISEPDLRAMWGETRPSQGDNWTGLYIAPLKCSPESKVLSSHDSGASDRSSRLKKTPFIPLLKQGGVYRRLHPYVLLPCAWEVFEKTYPMQPILIKD